MTKPISWHAATVLLTAAALAACGGGEPGSDGGQERPAARAPADGGEGSGGAAPARDPEQLALEGEELFQAKGCNACHTMGRGRLVGPDLLGVTDRREKDWIEAMIVKPDSMLQNDPEAKQLLSEYYTPMTSMGVTPEQAEALYQYLRAETEGASGAGT